MKALLETWNQISLVKRIVCGLAVGAVLALVLPGVYAVGLLGTLFVGALKAIAPLLVFFLVIASLARAKAGAGNMGRVVGLYLIGTFLAALTASKTTAAGSEPSLCLMSSTPTRSAQIWS